MNNNNNNNKNRRKKKKNINKNIKFWKLDDILIWLEELELKHLYDNFEENKINNGEILLTLNDEDLRNIGVDLIGYRRMILIDISKRCSDSFEVTNERKISLDLSSSFDKSINRKNSFNEKQPIVDDLEKEEKIVEDKVGDGGSAELIEKFWKRTSYFGGEFFQIWKREEELITSLSKLFFSFLYLVFVSFLTSLTMAIAHKRVPNQEQYPPLPDIMLDNIPLIPWAFKCAELIIMTEGLILVAILVVHKHRIVILRRFFVIIATVFLLRCVTMIVTSLSVPSVHLECDNSDLKNFSNEELLIYAINITKGFGLTVLDVKTCGDYIFSGHTSALTLINFTITEYSSDKWKGLHILSWILNIFGIFFVSAAHEHYTIDILMAFYISSRLFLHYHTLANTSPLLSEDHSALFKRSFFPIFSYMESDSKGAIKNEFIF
eukprot:TRINITY_DN1499_c0_g1_i1.p1 TRINITY_DN1499_c0_g1~~TRINITY_DN1499_c0_g1_i1.p1  ORF type:complete len:435 (+),score=67.64 TRINITY_DN1499_c0_g1_i1:98-1402(+)